jgi:hypothetical protein
MGIPYESNPVRFELPVGPSPVAVVVEVPLPSRCYIKRYTVVQFSGSSGDTVSLDFFNRREAAHHYADVANGLDGSEVAEDGVVYSDALFKFWSDSMAGTVHQYWGDDEGFMFFSHDDAPGRQGQKMRTLHLVVTGVAADSGPRVFHVIVGASVPDLA